ncbi:MAG TPA: spore germination protein, partial [Paenibacillaceae bacterium]|nr:spore germination protein [Paenibacillaceae bacterium]
MRFKKTVKAMVDRFSPPAPQQGNGNSGQEPQQEQESKKPLSLSLDKNIQEIKNSLGNSSDLVIREISMGTKGEIRACIAYTDGLVDVKTIQESILDSFLFKLRNTSPAINFERQDDTLLKYIREYALTIGEIKEIRDFPSLFPPLLSGETIILIDGFNQGFSASTKGAEHRSITEPTSQTTVRGPKEAFTELIRVNTSLIRRKIKDPNLWIETTQIGRVTKTDVSIMYIKGIAKEDVLQEIRSRLAKIDIDSILESGYIEEMIQDKTFTPFPTIYNTERPDSVAAGLLGGRVAILVDGTPFVLMVPALFVQFFQSPEDYYHRSDFGLLRMLRY